MVLALSTCAK